MITGELVLKVAAVIHKRPEGYLFTLIIPNIGSIDLLGHGTTIEESANNAAQALESVFDDVDLIVGLYE